MSNGVDIDKLFRDKLKSRSFKASEGSWAAMEELLDAQSSSSKKGFAWYWKAAAIVAAVSATFLLAPNFTSEEQLSEVGTSQSSSSSLLDNTVEEAQVVEETTDKPQEFGSSNVEAASADQNNTYSDLHASVNTTSTFKEKKATGSSQMAKTQVKGTATASQKSSFFIDLLDSKPFKSFLMSTDEKPMDKVIITDNGAANKNHLSVLFGANLSTGLESGSTESMGSGAYAAIKYEREVASDVRVSTGLGYYARTGAAMTNTVVDLDYSFGYEKTETTITTKNLHMIEAPIQLAWSPVSRHSILFGGSANYIASASNELEVNYESTFDEWSESSSEWGHVDGMNRWNFALNAGYEYGLSPNSSIGVMYSYGLSDITNNAYYQNNAFDRCQEFRLYFKYNLVNF